MNKGSFWRHWAAMGEKFVVNSDEQFSAHYFLNLAKWFNNTSESRMKLDRRRNGYLFLFAQHILFIFFNFLMSLEKKTFIYDMPPRHLTVKLKNWLHLGIIWNYVLLFFKFKKFGYFGKVTKSYLYVQFTP